jgi:hypothetical protein
MKRTKLNEVQNAQGRADVALYRLAELVCQRVESEQGVSGLREHVLPIVEDVIVRNVPAVNLIPREIQALLKVCELNARKEPEC